MATVDIDLSENSYVVIDQPDYDGDTVLNFITDGSLNVVVINSEHTPDVLEIQHTYTSHEPSEIYDYLTVNENVNIKLLSSINPPEGLYHHHYGVYGNSKLEITPEFLSQAPNQHVFEIQGLGGEVVFNTAGLSPDTLNISFSPDAEGSEITFANATSSEYSSSENSLVFKDSNGDIVGRATIDTRYTDPDQLGFDGGTVYYACYLQGTHIATPDGETKVEHLKAGDKVLTADGRVATVKWLGFRILYKSRIPEKDAYRAFPILFKKGCIANNVPHRDLLMSPGHHISFDGNLVPAMCLVNDKTIVQQFELHSFQYFHVELERFDILLAEGLPAESYVDTGNRNMFQNAAEVAINPDFGPAPGRPDRPGLTVVRKGPTVEAIRAKLLERAHWMQTPAEKRHVA